MTIPEALAKYPVQLSAQLIRCWISHGTCPFGYIVREKSNRHGKNTYYINEQELRKFLGGEEVCISTK